MVAKGVIMEERVKKYFGQDHETIRGHHTGYLIYNDQSINPKPESESFMCKG